MGGQEDELKWLPAIERKLSETKQAVEEAQQEEAQQALEEAKELSDRLPEGHNIRQAVHNITHASEDTSDAISTVLERTRRAWRRS